MCFVFVYSFSRERAGRGELEVVECRGDVLDMYGWGKIG